MPGCVQRLDFYVPNFKYLPIFRNNGFKVGLGIWTKDDWSSCLFAQVQVSGYKVRMEVSLKNVFQGNSVFFQTVQVRLYLTQGIYYCRLLSGNNVISSLSQASCIYLFYFHF